MSMGRATELPDRLGVTSLSAKWLLEQGDVSRKVLVRIDA